MELYRNQKSSPFVYSAHSTFQKGGAKQKNQTWKFALCDVIKGSDTSPIKVTAPQNKCFFLLCETTVSPSNPIEDPTKHHFKQEAKTQLFHRIIQDKQRTDFCLFVYWLLM